MHANTPDTLLLDHWRTRRDADAFAELVARYGPLVYSACLRVLRSTAAAEDAAQDCFVELLQSRAHVRSLPGFLHTTATRRAVDRLRSERSRADREARFAAGMPIIIEATWDDVSAHVDEAIAALPAKLQRPVILRFLQGRSYAEIASDTGLPASTIQYQLQQGIEGIRKHLAGRGLPISAAALGGMLVAAPSHALPAAATAHIGAIALAGISVTPVVVTGLLGGWISVKAIAAAMLAVATLAPAAYLLSRKDAPDAQSRNAPEIVVTPEGTAAAKAIPTVDTAPNVDAVVGTMELTVSGTVLGAGGIPEPDAHVAMYWNNNSWSARSDGSGKFVIALPLSFASGEDETTATVSLEADRENYKAFPEKYDVPSAGRSGITLKLQPVSTISGSVVDREGNPLAGWPVWARGANFGSSTHTAERGTYTIAGLPPGDYTVFAFDEGGQRAYYNGAATLSLKGATTISGINIVWPETDITLSGSVSGEDGLPITGVRIRATYSVATDEKDRNIVHAEAMSDDSGRYTLQGFPNISSLSLNLETFHENYIDEKRNEVTLGDLEEDFVLARKPIIEGRVVDAITREPITQYRIGHWMAPEVQLGPWDEDFLQSANRRELEYHSDGTFSIKLNGSNTVRVAIAAPGYKTGVKMLDGIDAGESIRDVEIQLEPAAVLFGIVVDASGKPANGAHIYIGYPTNSQIGRGGVAGPEGITTTDESGAFKLTEYPADLTVVSAYRDGFATGWATVASPSPIHIVLTAGATLEGTVTLNGMPMDSGQSSVTVSVGESTLTITSTSDVGAYSQDKLPAGNLTIAATFMEGGWRHIQRKVILETGKAQRQDFNFDLSGTTYIEGIVLLDGEPVPRSVVQASTVLENGDTVLQSAETRGDGGFKIGPLPADDYEFGALWIQLKDGSYLSPDAESVTVQDGETVKHDLLYSSR